MRWFLAQCHDCDVLEPFYTWADRDEWANAHYDATEHNLSLVQFDEDGSAPRPRHLSVVRGQGTVES